MEKVNCPICDSDNFEELFMARDLLYHTPGEFHVVRCKNCGLIMTNPRPSKEEISKYYPDNYGPHKHCKEEDKNLNSSTIIRYFRRRLPASLRRFYQIFMESNPGKIPKFNTPGKVFEFGCATGNFLKTLKDRGWKTEGVEIDKKSVDYANKEGLNVKCGRLEDFNFGTNKYDLIVAFMALEHVHNPVNVVKKLREMIKENGYFVFSVPNTDSWEFGFFKDKWQGLHIPVHLFHYNKSTIKKILSLGDFRLIKIYYQRSFISPVRSIAYLIEDKARRETRLSAYFKKFPQNNVRDKMLSIIFQCFAIISSLIHQNGRITIWAAPIQKR